jgi:uncharacterized protein YndB with AHSA1/START domain
MPPIVSTIEIARPPDDVFAYATDPTRFSEWQVGVVRVHMEDGRAPAVGSRFTTTRMIGGSERTMTQEITKLSPPWSWAARGVDGPLRPNATITVEPIDGGTRVTFALDYEGHGIGVPLVPLVRRQTQKAAPVNFRNLKQRLERDEDHEATSTPPAKPI